VRKLTSIVAGEPPVLERLPDHLLEARHLRAAVGRLGAQLARAAHLRRVRLEEVGARAGEHGAVVEVGGREGLQEAGDVLGGARLLLDALEAGHV